MESKDVSWDKGDEIQVSVCCITYNHEKYIEQALQGFVNQITNFRFEIIVHDDASTDNTKKIIQKYVDLYPDLFVPIYETENQYSKGRGIILPMMYSMARGKYIAQCDGDDYWIDEHKLQKQYDALETNRDCSICVHKTKPIYEDGAVIEPVVWTEKGKYGYNMNPGVIEKEKIATALWLQGGYPFHTPTYFIRKEVLEDQINGKAKFIKYWNGDLAAMGMSLLQGKFFCIDEIMACRRRGAKGSWSIRWNAYASQAKLEYFKDFITGDKMFDEYSHYQFHEYISQHLFKLVSECCIIDTSDIRKYLRENPLSIKIIHDKDSLWFYTRYLIMRISPKLYNLLYRIQRKMIKK